MTKDAEDRITDTVKFLKSNTRRGTASEEIYATVIDALETRLAAMGSVRRIKLSGLLSLENAGQRRPGSKATRQVVRGGLLLDLALSYPEPGWVKQAADQINLASQDPWAALEYAVERACGSVLSEPRYAGAMIDELRAHPLRVLNKHLITLDGGSKDGNPLTYRVWYESGGYRLSCYGTSGGYTIKALNVRATAYKDIKDSPGAVTAVDTGDGAGCNLLFTTQFTGCSFCFMKSGDGTNMRAAHIDPGKGTGAPSGSELSETMRGGGGFSGGNGGDFKVYGRVPDKSDLPGYPDSAGSMTIVGVRKGTEWRLYSQIKSMKGSIVSAQRIDTITKASEFRK